MYSRIVISTPQAPHKTARASHSARGQTAIACPANASWQSLQAQYTPQQAILIATISSSDRQCTHRVCASTSTPRTSGRFLSRIIFLRSWVGVVGARHSRARAELHRLPCLSGGGQPTKLSSRAKPRDLLFAAVIPNPPHFGGVRDLLHSSGGRTFPSTSAPLQIRIRRRITQRTQHRHHLSLMMKRMRNNVQQNKSRTLQFPNPFSRTSR